MIITAMPIIINFYRTVPQMRTVAMGESPGKEHIMFNNIFVASAQTVHMTVLVSKEAVR